MDVGLATTQEVVHELGVRLRAQRMARLMTQRELAERSGVALGSVKKLESSGRTTLETFVCVVHALGLIDDLAPVCVLQPHASITGMQRAALTERKRAPRRRVTPS